jgi:hypothetical protein
MIFSREEFLILQMFQENVPLDLSKLKFAESESIVTLVSGYPLITISYHCKRFFEQNHVTFLMEQLDNDMYRALHQQ